MLSEMKIQTYELVDATATMESSRFKWLRMADEIQCTHTRWAVAQHKNKTYTGSTTNFYQSMRLTCLTIK